MTIDVHAILKPDAAWTPLRDKHGSMWGEYDPQTRTIRIRRGHRTCLISIDALQGGQPALVTLSEPKP